MSALKSKKQKNSNPTGLITLNSSTEDIGTLSKKIDEYKAGEEKKKSQINALQTQAPAPEQLDVGEARKRLKASEILSSRSGGGGLKSLLGA